MTAAQAATLRTTTSILAGHGTAKVIANAAMLTPRPQVVAIGFALELHTYTTEEGD